MTDEEGFTQLAVVQPADDPTRPEDPVAAAAGDAAAGHGPVRQRAGRPMERMEPVRARGPGMPLNRSPTRRVAADPDPTMGEPVTPSR